MEADKTVKKNWNNCKEVGRKVSRKNQATIHPVNLPAWPT